MNSIEELNSKFKELVSQSAETVQDRVLNGMVEKEVDRRTGILTKLLDKAVTAEREMRKLSKPDNVIYAADGSEVSSGYSKGALEAVKKQQKLVDDLAKAWDEALTKGDFSNAEKLTAEKQTPEKPV